MLLLLSVPAAAGRVERLGIVAVSGNALFLEDAVDLGPDVVGETPIGRLDVFPQFVLVAHADKRHRHRLVAEDPCNCELGDGSIVVGGKVDESTRHAKSVEERLSLEKRKVERVASRPPVADSESGVGGEGTGQKTESE